MLKVFWRPLPLLSLMRMRVNVFLLTRKRYWQLRGWIYRCGSRSVHVKVMQPN